jgi:hypothetical protein
MPSALAAVPPGLSLPGLALALLSACAPPTRGTDSGAGDGGATDGGQQDGGADGGGADGGGTDGGGSDGGGSDGGTVAVEPSVRILFPQTRDDVTICPEFVMVVDVEGMELVDYRETPEHVEGQGHWHLFDSGDYVAAYVDDWALISLDNDGAVESHILTVELAQNDHTEIGVSATTEILVGPKDCIGGSAGSSGDGGGSGDGGSSGDGGGSGDGGHSHVVAGAGS